MADNTGLVVVTGTPGDVIRDIDRGTAKTQVVQLDVGGESSESLVTSSNPLPVSGTFFQTTQPVSIASMPSTPVTGTFFQTTQPVSIASMPSTPVTGTFFQTTQPVSGTFWQATQPVSIAAAAPVKPDGTTWTLTGTSANVDVTNASLAVTGTFWQATQPVSIAAAAPVKPDGTTWTLTGTSANVDVTNASLAVTGTFWQATQPVSIAAAAPVKPDGTTWTLTGTSANVDVTNASLAVTGTFWQATQPVSIAAAAPVKPDGTTWTLTGTSANVDVTNASLAVTGTFWQATQPVSGTVTANQGSANTATNAWPHKLVDSGGVNVATVKAASTAIAATDVPLAVGLHPSSPLPAGTNSLGAVTQATPASLQVTATPIAITKGTQGATGFTVQNLLDAGRNTRIFMLDAFTAAPVVEALQSVVQWYGNAAVSGTTGPAVVPAGKTLRLTGYKIMYQSLATVGCAVVRIRCNTTGVAVLASPLVYSFESGSGAGATTTAMTGGMTVQTGCFPDGLEFPAGAGIGFSMAGYGPTGTLTLEGTTRFAVYGFEY